MNDQTRQALERYFDGELSADDADLAFRLSREAEARRYLDQLAALRGLAVRHRRLACPLDIPLTPRRRYSRVWAVALAASVVAVVVGRFLATSVRPGEALVNASPARIDVEHSPDRLVRARDVAIYTWANAAQRRPERAARALLVPRTNSGKRPATVEILILELANASTEQAAALEPLALVHKPALGGRGKSERHGRRTRSIPPRA
jgi:hypothetical protein